MAVILAIYTKTASKHGFVDITHCFEASLFTTTIGTQYDHYRKHTTIIGTTKQSQKYVFFHKFYVFHGKNGCDCENKTYSNISNPLKHICTTTNCILYWYIYPSLNTITLCSRKSFSTQKTPLGLSKIKHEERNIYSNNIQIIDCWN